MYSDNMVIELNAVAHRYKDVIHRAIHDVLMKHRNTGAGAASLVVEVIDGDRQRAPQIRVTFADHVMLLDKRRLQWTRLPDVRKLMEWARTKKPTEGEAKRLAWAVAWDKRKNDTWKAKPWRKKSLSNVLKEMNELILQMMDKANEADLVEATKV